MVCCGTENGGAEQDPVGREIALQVLEDFGLATGRAGQAVEQVKQGDGVKGAHGVRQRLEDVVEEALDVRTPKARFCCVQGIRIEVAQGDFGIQGDVAVLEEIAGGDADVQVALADVCAEKGDHDLGRRAAPYDAAHELQDKVIVNYQCKVGIVVCTGCAIFFGAVCGEHHCREVFLGVLSKKYSKNWFLTNETC